MSPFASVKQGKLPTISIIVPVRNEEAHLQDALDALTAQDYPVDLVDIVVVDGRSEDRTTEIASEHARLRDPRVRVLDNPSRTRPAALNVGLESTTSDTVVFVDGHITIEPDFLSRSVRALVTERDAWCVGGRVITEPPVPSARHIAVAQGSRFGVGGAAFRTSDRAGFVDTVAFGLYWRWVFDRIGGFDEALVVTEDDEYNLRLLQAGGRIWMDPTIRVTYVCRRSLPELAKQYYRYGVYKPFVWRRRGSIASIRHLVPSALVLGLAGTSALAVTTQRRWPLAAASAAYGAAVLSTSVGAARGTDAPVAGVAAGVVSMHLSYGAGVLIGIGRAARLRD